jgi:diadenosine tetraphosphate (Ap4A) HIT family hydrolase
MLDPGRGWVAFLLTRGDVGPTRCRVSLLAMALRPDEFYDHAVAAADSECRLPLARMTGWDISPFEPDGLRVAPLRPPVLPEPARHGEDPADCHACRHRDTGIWFNDRWRLARITGVGVPLALMLYPRDHYDMADLPDELAAELGLLTTRIVGHIQALRHVSRAHVYRIGDGGAHLHIWFFARPEGQAQLYGSWLVVWDDLLPEYPADVADADAAIVADALIASYGGRRWVADGR